MRFNISCSPGPAFALTVAPKQGALAVHKSRGSRVLLGMLLCFFTTGVLGEAGALVLGVWAARDRAAARAVPNIKVVKRFIVFFLLGLFSLPSLPETRPEINQVLSFR